MEILEIAIERGELKEFLMGRGTYFVRDRDWGGHECSSTYMLIERYLKSSEVINDKNIIFELIDNEYVSILKKNGEDLGTIELIYEEL